MMTRTGGIMSKAKVSALVKVYLCGSVALASLKSFTFFTSEDGHYAAKGQVRTAPSMSSGESHLALEQSFRLLAEKRFNEKSSVFLEFRLFADPRNAYLGDQVSLTALPLKDSSNRTIFHQDPLYPSYEPYLPRVSQLYGQYAFDYCILEVGRRPRDWGLGLWNNSGKQPFSSTYSVYDGVSCRVNIQKSQVIGFYASYDKLAESLYQTSNNGTLEASKGPNDKSSDLNQYTFAIELDDPEELGAYASFHKKLGLSYAYIGSEAVDKGGLGAGLNIIDLYANFLLPQQHLVSKSEFLFVFGDMGGAASSHLGGARLSKEKVSEMASNKVDSVFAFATNIEWSFFQSGSYLGPKEYNQGDFSKHVLFADLAIAPGDGQGYFDESKESLKNKRNNKTKAFKFNPNYKLALIMFNGRSQVDDLKVDGVFDPNSLMNTRVFSLGYRYESLSIGHIEGRLTYGQLIADMPDEVKVFYTNQVNEKRPVGFYSKDLGLELDVSYRLPLSNAFEFGVDMGLLFPGKAWKREEAKDPENSFLLQSSILFRL